MQKGVPNFIGIASTIPAESSRSFHAHALRRALDDVDETVPLHPPELVEQLGPAVVPLEKLKANRSAVRHLKERAIARFMPEDQPLRQVLECDDQRPSRVAVRIGRGFE